MYRITYDPALQLITTTIDGLLTVDQSRAFAEDLGRQMMTLMHQRVPFKMLMDSSRAPVQSQASYDQFQDIGRMVKRAAPTAIVVGSTLGKMQASRDINNENVHIFHTVLEARLWLASIEPYVMEMHPEALVSL